MPREKHPLGQTVVKANEHRELTGLFTRRYLEQQLLTLLAGRAGALAGCGLRGRLRGEWPSAQGRAWLGRQYSAAAYVSVGCCVAAESRPLAPAAAGSRGANVRCP